jgi:DNA-binding XRE family transcriptional regulator
MLGLQRLTLEGKRFVVMPEPEYERLCHQAGKGIEEDDLPPLPPPDKDGNYPALEFGRMSLARDLIRDRKSVGLSQQQLAKLASVRQETLSRIESGKHTATPRTIDKITGAIETERKRQRKQKGR